MMNKQLEEFIENIDTSLTIQRKLLSATKDRSKIQAIMKRIDELLDERLKYMQIRDNK